MFWTTIIGLSLFASVACSQVNVVALGAHPDGTNAPATTNAFRSAFSTYPTGEIVVPAGKYLIDNSSGPLTIENFSGHLEFQGNAQLIFTTNNLGGVLFVGGNGARIHGLRATYAIAPTYRASPNEQIKFSDTTDTLLTDTFVERSPAAGILFYNSVRPKVVNATVMNSLADGLHFANCEDPQVTNLTTLNTGDDGLAFVNYAAYPNKNGGLAENIKVQNSQARGIAVVGQSNVTISGFQIETTEGSGLLVAEDDYFNTRVPANVRIQNGTIHGAGTLGQPGGNRFGIEFNSQVNATFSNITILDSADAGLSGTSPNGSVTVNNVTVESPRDGVGFLFYETGSVQISDSVAQNTPSYGFLFLFSPQVMAQGLTAVNTSRKDPLRRAVWFENGHSILATDLKISSARGDANVVGAYQDHGYQQSGSIKGIAASITGASLSIQNNSSKLTIAQ